MTKDRYCPHCRKVTKQVKGYQQRWPRKQGPYWSCNECWNNMPVVVEAK